MTIPVLTSSIEEYTGNGVTDEFDYPFKITDEADLTVTTRDTDGNPTTLTLSTDYTVSGVGDDAGGSITLTAGALASGYKIIIEDDLAIEQPVPFGNQSAFFPNKHEDSFDRLTRQILKNASAVQRCIRLASSDSVDSANLLLPNAGLRASRFLGFDSNGGIELYTSIGSTVLSRSAVGALLWPETDAERAAGVTVIDEAYPSDEGPYIDIRRYGAVLDGAWNGSSWTGTDNTAALDAAIDVAKERGAGQVFIAEGICLITSVIVSQRYITLFGVNASGSAGEEAYGSAIVSNNTTGDIVRYGNGAVSAQGCGMYELRVQCRSSGAAVHLNNAPFFTLKKSHIVNDYNGACYGIYAYDSHHFGAYESHIVKEDSANERTTGSIGFRCARSGTIGGLYSFFNSRIKNFQVGWDIGQHSLNLWEDSTRDYTGAAQYPCESNDVGLTLVGSQGKGNGTDIKIGSGVEQAYITGGYFEAATQQSILLTYGCRNVLITGNMFNTDASRVIRAGRFTSHDEEKEFWNIMVFGNWFRKVGGDAVQVTGRTQATSLVKIYDNDFELDDPAARAIGINGNDSDRTYDVRRNTYTVTAAGAGAVFCDTIVSGSGDIRRPIRWEDTPIETSDRAVERANVQELTSGKNLTIDDAEIQRLSCDTVNRNCDLPDPATAEGKRFTIINNDNTYSIVLRDYTATFTFCTLAPRTVNVSPTPDDVQYAECVCDGEKWTVRYVTDGLME